MMQYSDLIDISDLSEDNQKVVKRLVPILRRICIDLLKSEIDSELNTNLDHDKDGVLDEGDDNTHVNDDDNHEDDKVGCETIKNVDMDIEILPLISSGDRESDIANVSVRDQCEIGLTKTDAIEDRRGSPGPHSRSRSAWRDFDRRRDSERTSRSPVSKRRYPDFRDNPYIGAIVDERAMRTSDSFTEGIPTPGRHVGVGTWGERFGRRPQQSRNIIPPI